MSTNKLLNLPINTTATISVKFPVTGNDKLIDISLTDAMIQVIDNKTDGEDAVIGEGRLNKNGEFKFKVAKKNLDFRVEVTSIYDPKKYKTSDNDPKANRDNDRSTFLVQTLNDKYNENNEKHKNHTVIFNNQLQCKIEETKEQDPSNATKEVVTNPWSIFQAMVELVEATEEKLELYGSYGPIYSYSTGNSSGFSKGKQVIHMNKNKHLFWSTIGHEFAHAVSYKFNITNKDIQGAMHELYKNQYDYPDSVTQGRKEPAMSLAFNEAFATWLSASLLKDSTNYLKICNMFSTKFQTNQFLNYIENNDGSAGVMVRSLEQGSVVYGEDAELAIVQLLWNITNKRKNPFERIEPKGKITNEVNIDLKTLFDQVLKESEFKNISEFYGKLYDYYTTNELPAGDLATVKFKKLEKITKLGYLFAEFGIAPNIDREAQKKNKLVWYQHKTGKLPAHDQFKLYFFDVRSGKLLYETNDLTIEAKKIGDYQYGYEYQLNNTASSKLKNYDETSIRVLIAATGNKQFKTGPYFNHVSTSFEPYDNFIPDPSGRTGFLEPGIALRLGSINGRKIRVSPITMGDIEYELVTDPWEKGLSFIAINTSSRPIFIMHGTREIPGIETHEDGSEEDVMIEAPSCKELEWEWE